jgi:6,7-dimethyl-8-ribityllumazine synthase
MMKMGHLKQARVLIIASDFNKDFCERLVAGAQDTLQKESVQTIDVIWVPGAFELPTAASLAATSKKWDAIIAIGCLIQGDTPHFHYISQAVSQGLMMIGLEHKLPVIFGVLTTDTIEQALERSKDIREQAPAPVSEPGGFFKDHFCNKGEEAAKAAIYMLHSLKKINEAHS